MKKKKASKKKKIRIPHTVVSWAVPLDRVRLDGWLKAVDSGQENVECVFTYDRMV